MDSTSILTPAQKAAQTRARRKPLTESENATLDRIATLRELWKETGPCDYRVDEARLHIAGCKIYLALGDPTVTVEGNDVTNISGPWHEALREQLASKLIEAEKYADDKPNRVKAAKAWEDQAVKARLKATKNAALKAYGR